MALVNAISSHRLYRGSPFALELPIPAIVVCPSGGRLGPDLPSLDPSTLLSLARVLRCPAHACGSIPLRYTYVRLPTPYGVPATFPWIPLPDSRRNADTIPNRWVRGNRFSFRPKASVCRAVLLCLRLYIVPRYFVKSVGLEGIKRLQNHRLCERVSSCNPVYAIRCYARVRIPRYEVVA